MFKARIIEPKGFGKGLLQVLMYAEDPQFGGMAFLGSMGPAERVSLYLYKNFTIVIAFNDKTYLNLSVDEVEVEADLSDEAKDRIIIRDHRKEAECSAR